MSYILDALRKADAQRANDPARGIHAQTPIALTAATADRGRHGLLLWGLGTALALMVALGAWLGTSGVSPAPAVPAPAPVVRFEPGPASLSAPVTPATVVLPAAPEPVVVLAPKKTAVVAPVPPAAPAAPAPPADQRTYSLAELPPEVQQALPKFSVSGGVYSQNVAQRMLVVDGQVFNEGSEIASGVILEQIGPRVALLRFRGLRLVQPY